MSHEIDREFWSAILAGILFAVITLSICWNLHTWNVKTGQLTVTQMKGNIASVQFSRSIRNKKNAYCPYKLTIGDMGKSW